MAGDVTAQPESELISAAKAGSVNAFSELVHRYQVRLLRFLLTRCPSHADAEDALQDTLLNAWRYLHSYDPRWRFSTWIYRIAIRNAAGTRKRTLQALRDGTEVGEIGDASGDPLAKCIVTSDRENLWLSAKRVLNAEVYTAMWLRYAEDMSIRDVARVLDRSSAWTKVNLMRGRQALDAELGRVAAKESEAYG